MSITYDEFQAEMDDTVEPFMVIVEEVKDIFSNFSWSNLMTSFPKILSTLIMLVSAAYKVCNDLVIEDEDVQHDYLAKYLDYLFTFSNWLESFDYTIFKVAIKGIDALFDLVIKDDLREFDTDKFLKLLQKTS